VFTLVWRQTLFDAQQARHNSDQAVA
jgi:hypothetical protein